MAFRPTDEMSRAAQRGLRMRAQQPRSNRGGTAVGLARANQFANRELVSLDTVRRTFAFLSRAAEFYKPGSESPGTQAYLLWGGPAGLSWARQILKNYGGK